MAEQKMDLSLFDGHTPGPLQWYGNIRTQLIYLATRDRGRLIVMDFVRRGMRGATVRFRTPECLMERAEHLATPDYNGDFEPDHPDARLMKHAPRLLSELKAAREEIAKMETRNHFLAEQIADLAKTLEANQAVSRLLHLKIEAMENQEQRMAEEALSAAEKIRLLVADCARAETERDAYRAALPDPDRLHVAAQQSRPMASTFLRAWEKTIRAVLARFPRDGRLREVFTLGFGGLSVCGSCGRTIVDGEGHAEGCPKAVKPPLKIQGENHYKDHVIRSMPLPGDWAGKGEKL